MLWEQCRQDLFTLCLRYMDGNYADAEDALAQVMMEAREALPGRAQEIVMLRPWLAQLARHICIDFQRSRLRHQRAVKLIEAESSLVMAETNGHSAEKDLLRSEVQSEFYQMIASLPEAWRKPFILRYFRQMSCDEVAEQMNLSPEAVRKRLQHSRQFLREKLKGDVPESELIQGLRFDSRELTRATGEVMARPKRSELESGAPEIVSPFARTRLVQVQLPCKVNREFRLFLQGTPAREAQRIQALSAHTKAHPRSWKKLQELVEILYATGQWKAAILAWSRRSGPRPGGPGTALRLGLMLRAMGQPAEAAAVYEEASLAARRPATRRHLNGLIALCRRDCKLAAQEFAAAASGEPGNAAHWHGLAAAHYCAHSHAEMLEALEQALSLNPGDLVALTAGHQALMATHQEAEAWKRANRVLELAPDDVLTLQQVAENRCRGGLIHGAAGKQTKRLIRRILGLAPDSDAASASLGCYLVARGDIAEGLAFSRRWTEKHTYCAHGWHQYASLAAMAGETQAAAQALAQARLLDKQPSGACSGVCRTPYFQLNACNSRPTTAPETIGFIR